MSLYLKYSAELQLPETLTLGEFGEIKEAFRKAAREVVDKYKGTFEDDAQTINKI